MSNRGPSSYNRRKPKKRITGRFYAFLTVILVLVVAIVVALTQRGGGSRVATADPTKPANTAATDEWTDADAEATEAPANGSIDDLIESDPDLQPLEGDQKVKVDSLSVTEGLSPDWHNILLLGSDTRNIKKVSRTDTIIIASINVNDGRIKLTSIMRDTVVPIPGHGDKKINSASYYGGPELTMKMVNELFKLNITEYVLVNFASFREVVDILGGIELDVTKEEMDQVNHSLKEQARLLKLSKETYLAGGYDLKTFGPATHMDGLQALGYARIRHIDSDYQRTERQRMVIDAAVKKMRGSVSVRQLVQLATSMWQYIDTNVNMMSAIGLATTVLKSGVGKMSTGLLPLNGTYKSDSRSSNGAALYDTDFAANAARLYQFIYVDP